MSTTLSEKTIMKLKRLQRNEVTESYVYRRIASRLPEGENQNVLLQIASDEERHCALWQKYTKTEIKPNRLKIFWFLLIERILGFTFAIKLMEKGENLASYNYTSLSEEVPEALTIAQEEDEHEQKLIAMLDEERLQYVGSMVLGLNDALVELSGTLAGLTFALQNTRIIALSGVITGISATLSMASSEYLSARSEENENALKSGLYTGVVYLLTVVVLVLPYLLLPVHSYMLALAIMLVSVILIIIGFTYYISVAKDLPFFKRFAEMAGISLGVATLSFFIGIAVKRFLGIDI